jgi:hypothetical protein
MLSGIINVLYHFSIKDDIETVGESGRTYCIYVEEADDAPNKERFD